jgi:hypothetical protein
MLIAALLFFAIPTATIVVAPVLDGKEVQSDVERRHRETIEAIKRR